MLLKKKISSLRAAYLTAIAMRHDEEIKECESTRASNIQNAARGCQVVQQIEREASAQGLFITGPNPNRKDPSASFKHGLIV